MIDGVDPERIVIEEVYPFLSIRLYQFHDMQSVSAQLRGIFGASSPESKLKVNQCLNPIREAQRCPLEEEWESTRDRLLAAIQEIAGDDHQDKSRRISSWITLIVNGLGIYGETTASITDPLPTSPTGKNNCRENTISQRIVD
jgi:hypothetical protein